MSKGLDMFPKDHRNRATSGADCSGVASLTPSAVGIFTDFPIPVVELIGMA